MKSIVIQSSQNLGRWLKNRISWWSVWGIAFCSLLFATFVYQSYWPTYQLKVQDKFKGWITIDRPTVRSYFRNSFWLNHTPDNAWLTLASNDYRLYVNGFLIGANQYSINASHGFTTKLLQKEQRLVSNQQFILARAPELQKRANNEHRMGHYYDLTPYLRAGLNNISIALQADSQTRFTLYGRIHTDEADFHIATDPNTWKAHDLANSDVAGRKWYEIDFHDFEWSSAVDGGPIETHIYSFDIESVWARHFDPQPIVLDDLPGGDRLRSVMPHRGQFNHVTELSSWLRIESTRPYSLFIDDFFVGDSDGGVLKVFDISQYVSDQNRYISITTQPSLDGDDQSNWIKVDGNVLGNPVDPFLNWSAYIGNNDNWLLLDKSLSPQDWREAKYTETFQNNPKRDYIAQPIYSEFSVQTFFTVAAYLFFVLVCIALFNHFKKRYHYNKSQVFSYWWLLSFISMAVVMVEILRIRFVESDASLFFWSSHGQQLLIVFVLAMCVFGWLLKRFPEHGQESDSTPQVVTPATTYKSDTASYIILGFIIFVGVVLRVYDIGIEDLQADENVSWDAARGILRTGAPEAVSGILYTRSPLYHYLLAGWLWLWGDDIIVARLFSVLPAIGSMIMAFVLVRTITHNRFLALATALFFCLDSWQIQISHIIRFYQQMQFFGMLATYFFILGFIWQRGKRYQVAFFMSCLAGALSQEVFVIVFPAYSIAFVLFYKKFDWKNDLHLVIGFITTMLIIIIDIYIFTVTCLTPHVSVATTSGSILQLHLSNIMGFSNTFLVGNNRANLLLTIVALIGFFFWIRKANKIIYLFYLMIVLTLITATVLIMQIAARYLIVIYPYLIILCVLSLYYAPAYLARRLSKKEELNLVDPVKLSLLRNRWITASRVLIFATLFINLELWKTLDSYGHPRFTQHVTALEYIAKHREEQDKLISVHPMPAAILFGGIDYYLMDKVFFDELYVVDHGAVDRWSGGVLVSNIDKMREVFLRHDRVWVVLDELEMRNLSLELRDFIRESTVIQKEYFGVEVILWDKTHGKLAMINDRGGAYNRY
ncbi:hypothetical protein [Litoribacillus peritrichatus]|uniref:Glycosyltransferase RgtA/B/C/D-like domain-containing protein n=1 Tax=Litoribacillus peritrichatus TaxID=718191 RepID=A0ABP7M6E6_9GAMM